MMRWEFMSSYSEDIWDDLGKRGWELVSVVARGNNNPTAYFKRPLPSRSSPEAEVTKVQADPEPAKPRCEPPEWAKGERWHWLKSINGSISPWEWSSDLHAWQQHGDIQRYGSEEIASAMKWHSVAKPTSPPTREQQAELASLPERLLSAACKVGSCQCGAPAYAELPTHREDCWHRLAVEAANAIASRPTGKPA